MSSASSKCVSYKNIIADKHFSHSFLSLPIVLSNFTLEDSLQPLSVIILGGFNSMFPCSNSNRSTDFN